MALPKTTLKGIVTSFIIEIRVGGIAYRVAHAFAIDSLDWFEENQFYNVEFFLYSVWGESKPLYSKDEALKLARKMYNMIGYTGYGICFINREEYSFPC